MSKILITNKQRNLIINSEAAKGNFEDLYELLKKKDAITTNDKEELPVLKKLSSYYDDLLDACRSEWEVSKTQPSTDLGENFRDFKSVCDLCGYKYLKIVNRIYNKINKKTLVIGTECVKEFGEEISGFVALAQRDAKRAANRFTLEEEMPGVRNYIDSLHNYLNSLEIIIPNSLASRWNDVSSKLKSSYENYINEKNKNIDIVRGLWEEIKEIDYEIEQFINENKDKKFIGSKKILDWLLLHKEYEVIQMIRDNSGFINWAIAHRIFEPNFIKLLLVELNQHLNKMNINILTLDPKHGMVDLEFKQDRKTIIGTIKYKDLILNHGGFVFNEPIDDKFEDIYNNCKIKDKYSQDKILDLITKGESQYRLFKEYYLDNELIFIKGDMYYLVNYNSLINRLKKDFFKETQSLRINEVLEVNIIRSMNEKDYENYRQAKELASELELK